MNILHLVSFWFLQKHIKTYVCILNIIVPVKYIVIIIADLEWHNIFHHLCYFGLNIGSCPKPIKVDVLLFCGFPPVEILDSYPK